MTTSVAEEKYTIHKHDRDLAVRQIADALYDLSPRTKPQHEAKHEAYCTAVDCVEAWLVEIGAEVER